VRDSSRRNDDVSAPAVGNLKAEHLTQPFGIENRRPSLAWQISAPHRGARQSSYRLLVATSEAALESGRPDLWDSGVVVSDATFAIPYDGASLSSRQRCWWKVQVWLDAEADPVESETSWWEMGLLEPADWGATWLAAETPEERADREAGAEWIWGPVEEGGRIGFRRSFELPDGASAAELFVMVNDWPWWSQVVGVWIDGDPVIASSSWRDRSAPDEAGEGSLATGRKIALLGAYSPGRHSLALEVEYRGPHFDGGEALTADGAFAERYRPAVIGIARFVTPAGDHRVVTDGSWVTCATEDPEWPRSDPDDPRPAVDVVDIPGYDPLPPRPAVRMRREFEVRTGVARARLYITALGAYEAHLNGDRIGDALLTPEPSQYDTRVFYRSFDVTDQVRPGANALGVTIGDGWFASYDGRYAWAPGPRRVLAQLEIEHADGTRQVVATDSNWRIDESEIRVSEMRIGEVHDLRLAAPGWSTAGYDASGWARAEIAEAPAITLTAHAGHPIRAVDSIPPSSVTKLAGGSWVVDFGIHTSGWCRLSVQGEAGSRIDIGYGDELDSRGAVTVHGLSDPTGAPMRDSFLLSGGPAADVLEPRFVYRGFRYVQIDGVTGPLDPDAVRAIFVTSDLPIGSSFASDVDILDAVWRNVLRTQRTNLVGVPTDNDTRELRPYHSEWGIFWDTASFNADVTEFTRRLMMHLRDRQFDNGAFPDLAPYPLHGNTFANPPGVSGPAHGDVVLPWVTWRRSGDTSIIDENWDAMSRYLAFVLERNPDHVWRRGRGNDFYGDWLALDMTASREFLATAQWARGVGLMRDMAGATGRRQEEARLAGLFEQIRRAFQSAYVDPSGVIGSDSQICYVLALAFDLLDGPLREDAARRLIAALRDTGTALTTGILGSHLILDVLVDVGAADLAYDLLLRTDKPSWGHMVVSGATTVGENWEGSGAPSQTTLGSLSGFLMRRIAGIDAAEPGFRTLRIRPTPDPSNRLRVCSAHYDSAIGRIATRWERAEDGSFALEVAVPANASALVRLPASRAAELREGGEPIDGSRDVAVVDRQETFAEIRVASGEYRFTAEER
jgi:alpha-L-rhamnosidase